MKNGNADIRDILSVLKQCYIDRNNGNIVDLSKLLFSHDSQPIIIGTSNNEWNFGVEESERLFLSDWEGWGNVSIDIENAVSGETGSYLWFYVPAGVEYCFDDDEDTYSAFMEDASEIASSKKSPLSQAGEIVWLLSHLLHNRPSGMRKYVWDMTISGIMDANERKIRIMQFSIPVVSRYSDVRIDTNQEDAAQYKDECQKISDYNSRYNAGADAALIEQIAHLFDNGENISFTADTVYRYIGTDGIKRNGKEQIDYMNAIRAKGVKPIFPTENIILSRNGNDFTFCGVGLFSRDVFLESELKAILLDIERYHNMDNQKEALFRLRRDLTHVIKESASPGLMTEPFRIEGVGQLTQAKDIIIEYMQISFPFNCILEQKTDAVRGI